MAETYYAWTNFNVVDPKDPHNRKNIKKFAPGDVVTATDLGIDDEEFQSLVDAGAIRNYEHPDMGGFPGSPVELAKAKLYAQAQGGFFDTQYGRVGVDEAPEVDPETAKSLAGTPGT